MAQVPEDEVTQETLTQWYNLQQQLKKDKASESLLRAKIFKHYFPEPTEGVNKHDLNDGTGFILKATHVLNRNIDDGALGAIKEQLVKAECNVDLIVDRKPTLKKGNYNKLPDATKLIFDQCLIIKPGSPTLEIMQPASNKPKV